MAVHTSVVAPEPTDRTVADIWANGGQKYSRACRYESTVSIAKRALPKESRCTCTRTLCCRPNGIGYSIAIDHDSGVTYATLAVPDQTSQALAGIRLVIPTCAAIDDCTVTVACIDSPEEAIVADTSIRVIDIKGDTVGQSVTVESIARAVFASPIEAKIAVTCGGAFIG